MEKSEIQSRVKNIISLEDFARLLNEIKNDEFGNNKYPITESLLIHYSFKFFTSEKKAEGFVRSMHHAINYRYCFMS